MEEIPLGFQAANSVTNSKLKFFVHYLTSDLDIAFDTNNVKVLKICIRRSNT